MYLFTSRNYVELGGFRNNSTLLRIALLARGTDYLQLESNIRFCTNSAVLEEKRYRGLFFNLPYCSIYPFFVGGGTCSQAENVGKMFFFFYGYSASHTEQLGAVLGWVNVQ